MNWRGTSVLTRIAAILALALFGLAGYEVAVTLAARPEPASEVRLSGHLARLRTNIGALEQQSLVEATTAERWRELFAWCREDAKELETGSLDLGESTEYLLRAFARLSQAEEMRHRLLISEWEESRRSSLETDFRTTIGLAVSDVNRVIRILTSTTRAAPKPPPAPDPFRIAGCLIAVLIAALLAVQEVGTSRRKTRDPRPVTSSSEQRMAGNLAIHFNQLLTPITGYAELVLDTLAEDDPNRNDVEDILRAGQQAAMLSGQLQSLCRVQELELVPVDLHTWIPHYQETLQLLLGDTIELEVELDKALCTVVADPVQLRRMFGALALNASDAMPEGGVVRIRTAPVERADKMMVLLEFADTGRDTGLSLTAVQEIVENLGGDITVDSFPTEGTTFRIHLPRLMKPVADGVPAQARAAHA